MSGALSQGLRRGLALRCHFSDGRACASFQHSSGCRRAVHSRQQAQASAASNGSEPSTSGRWEEPVAAYVHLPFCKKKCSYCDFPVVALGGSGQDAAAQDSMSDYVDLLLREVAATARLNRVPLRSVFFGGGTPSLIRPALLERILEALEASFGIAAGAEISMEADPGTFDADSLRAYLRLGVTRVSVGVQAFQDELLSLCGRSHDVADAYRAIEAVHAAGPASWSLDVMSGLPQLTEGAWAASLAAALAAGPDHVSTYDLQVEEGTPFARRYSPGVAPLPADDVAARMYCTASEVLRGAGYEHYEVSNYARPGHRCAHNMAYWEGRSFYSFGMGSASYLQGRRYSRPKGMRAYREWVAELAACAAAGGPCVPGSELPPESADDLLLDTIMLRLRLADGLDLARLAASHPDSAEAADLIMAAMQPHLEDGLAHLTPGRGGGPGTLRLTDPLGLVVSNDVISDVFAAFDLTDDEE